MGSDCFLTRPIKPLGTSAAAIRTGRISCSRRCLLRRAATIVSGAVAERVKLSSFMIFSTVFVAFVYPWLGSWKWGGGWLDGMGFYDFAGSTLVHSVGGWGALAGAMLLGPRIGKYTKDGRLTPIPGSNLPLATVGVFLLWLGWFGFNGGSVLSADPALVSLTLVTTCLAAAGGCLGAMMTSWVMSKKPDLSMTLNGILAGLVGITAGADQMGMLSSIAIGVIAGVIVVYSVIFFDRVKIDDPVGAISVHLVCGIWGTLAVGLFGEMAGVGQFFTQFIGVAAYGVTSFAIACGLFALLKATIGIRVDPEEEVNGLDLSEHGMSAYPDFATTTVGGLHGSYFMGTSSAGRRASEGNVAEEKGASDDAAAEFGPPSAVSKA